jgi:PAS domain S-box-containing protein
MKISRGHWAILIGFLLVYFLSGRLGLALAFSNPSASPVWPPSGLSLAAILFLGYRICPAIFIGAFLVNWTTSHSVPASLTIAVGNTMEAMLAAFFVERFAGGRACLQQAGSVLKFIVLAGILATALDAMWGAGSLCAWGLAPWSYFGSIFVTWWLGDMSSNLIVAPFLIALAASPMPSLSRTRALEALPLIVATVMGLVVFGAWFPSMVRNYPLEFLAIPVVIWSAFQCGQRCTTTLVLMMSAIAVLGTLNGYGPFSISTPNESLLLLQAYMCTMSLTGLFLSSVLAERGRAKETLQSQFMDELATEKKVHAQLGKALEMNEEKYRQLVELSPDGIYIESDGYIVFANTAMAKLLGVDSPDLLLGKEILGFVHPDSKEIVLERIRVVKEKREYVPLLEEKFLRRDGSVVEVEATAAPYTFMGNPAAQVMIRNITRRKMLEEQVRHTQKMDALGLLAGGIAHDFNNVLASMLGYARLGLDALPENHELRDDLKQILKAGDHGKDLASRILLFSRNSGTMEKKMVSQMEDLIEDTMKMLRPTLPSTTRIEFDRASTLPCVRVDPAQIRQVLANLCINSSQAMPEGGVITVKLREVHLDGTNGESFPTGAKSGRSLKPGAYLALSVRDTGHGIAPHVLPRIFDPFFTTKKEHEGVGMGLAVVYGIVRGHGGVIRVESEPGEGAEFEIFLPVCEARVSEIRRLDQPVVGGKESILVVDDEELVAEMVAKTLRRLGYNVQVRYRVSEALELLQAPKAKFDLAVIDQTMPEMTGDRLAERIAKMKPDLPVILCTGYAPALHQSEVIQFSVKAILKKPFAEHELELAVRRILDESIKLRAA